MKKKRFFYKAVATQGSGAMQTVSRATVDAGAPCDLNSFSEINEVLFRLHQQAEADLVRLGLDPNTLNISIAFKET